MGDIGTEKKEYTFEPIQVPAQPIPAPQEAPKPEKVPA